MEIVVKYRSAWSRRAPISRAAQITEVRLNERACRVDDLKAPRGSEREFGRPRPPSLRAYSDCSFRERGTSLTLVQIVEAGVGARLREQIMVGAAFNNSPPLHHNDPVCHAHR